MTGNRQSCSVCPHKTKACFSLLLIAVKYDKAQFFVLFSVFTKSQVIRRKNFKLCNIVRNRNLQLRKSNL